MQNFRLWTYYLESPLQQEPWVICVHTRAGEATTSRLSSQQAARQHHQAKSRAQAVSRTSGTRAPGDPSVQPQRTPTSPGGEHPLFVLLQPQIWELAELRQVFRPIKNAVQTFSQQIYILSTYWKDREKCHRHTHALLELTCDGEDRHQTSKFCTINA